MIKFIAASFFIASLAACSSMYGQPNKMGNSAETMNSTNANKSGNPAAVSPGSSGSPSGAAPR